MEGEEFVHDKNIIYKILDKGTPLKRYPHAKRQDYFAVIFAYEGDKYLLRKMGRKHKVSRLTGRIPDRRLFKIFG